MHFCAKGKYVILYLKCQLVKIHLESQYVETLNERFRFVFFNPKKYSVAHYRN